MERVGGVAVLAFLGLLAAAIGVNVVLNARERADRLRCLEHLGRLAKFGGVDYAKAHDGKLPPGTLPNAGLPPSDRLSLFAELLVPLGRDDLAAKLDPTRGWRDDANAATVGPVVVPFLCPSRALASKPASPGPSHFAGLSGRGVDAAEKPVGSPDAGLFRYDGATPLDAVADGLGYTAAFAEVSTGIGPWAAGGPGTVRGADPASPPVGPGRPFGGNHPGGANVTFADASGRFVADTVSPRVFAALATIAGGAADEGP